jgi:NADPH:quinone reductase-like Zn-dependent oxidoreductase
VLAALYRRPGAADVLSVEEVETPQPGPGEVAVRLRVAGVNPTDWKTRGRKQPATFQVPGQDGAGDVVAVGEGVDAARVGERVWVWFAEAHGQWGTAAQVTVVPSRQAVALPDGASYDLGAGLGIPAMTAWHCLFADGPLHGRTVLVAGGAGAVGNAAIALAARGGAHVVTTVGDDRSAELALAAGAHAVVDRHGPDLAGRVLAAAPDRVDRVVEVALGANLALDLAVLAPRGVVSTYADDPLPDLPVRELMVANATLAFVLVYGIGDSALDRAVRGVSEAVAVQALPPLPAVRFPLQEVAAAHDAVQSGGVRGKVLLDLPG